MAALLRFAAAAGCLLVAGCGGSQPPRLPEQSTVHVEASIRDSDVIDLSHGSPTTALGELRLRPDACNGVDLRPEFRDLQVGQLIEFLRASGYELSETRARHDLSYLDLKTPNGPVRLRVATLDSSRAAGRDLHEAILQHGPGSWGVHRSNLAVLAPSANIEDMIAFALKSRLACWGVLTVAGRDDDFVVPGGYAEL
jgi:hypothetical protein